VSPAHGDAGPTTATLWVLWALHPKVGHWIPIVGGMSPRMATDELIVRRDRLRRAGIECRLKVLPEGERPR